MIRILEKSIDGVFDELYRHEANLRLMELSLSDPLRFKSSRARFNHYKTGVEGIRKIKKLRRIIFDLEYCKNLYLQSQDDANNF